MNTQTRSAGSPDPALEENPPTTVREALDFIHMFFRKDFGGQDQTAVVTSRLREAGITPSSDTISAYILGADHTKDGIRTRVMRRVDAAKRLLGYL